MSKKTIYVIIAHLLCSLQLIAQQPQATNDSSADIIKADESASQSDSTKTRIIFKEAENFIRESKDDLDIQTAKGNVKIVHEQTQISPYTTVTLPPHSMVVLTTR